jgi:site-specific DNA-methyltransferase (cytosine-N4-specific)
VQRSDLPFGSEFSPSQIDLAELLELAKANRGDWKRFEKAVRARYFDSYPSSNRNKAKLANNTRLSMIAYGLILRDATLTAKGERLYALRKDGTQLYEEFARHILLSLNGLAFVQCIQDMQAAGEQVTLVKLREWLEERGLHFPRGGKHASTLRLWLAKAGVFLRLWRVDEARLQELIGMATEDLEALTVCTREQRAYLRALANIGGTGPYASNDIEKLAAATYGVRFNEKSLPKTVLYPLRDAGYISLERGTREEGRGAKPFLVTPTPKLVSDVVEPLLDQVDKQVGADLRLLLCKPFADILQELTAADRHVCGLALEALAFKLMRLIDLTYVATRLRGAVTGGAEVDLIFESSRLVFSRWQVQCKNTPHVLLDDVAKEVGLTHMLKSNAIVMVSTGQIGPEARRYANKIMADSNLCVIMVDGEDLGLIQDNPTLIVDVFNREAKHAMQLKAIEI